MIVDAFAGPGGWSEGLRQLGLTDIGIEFDPSACTTRSAAGHRTIRADVTRMPLDHLAGRVDGLIMSPPCQAFSSAGKGDGRAALERLRSLINRGTWASDEAGAEVLEVGRWAETIRPTWIACEQVPPVLPLWRVYASRWRALYGWSCWAGLLCAADYGVPQTRARAFLLARMDGTAQPPAPTHAKGGAATLFGGLARWVSMEDALGWAGEDLPARTLCGDRAPRWLYPDADGHRGRMVLNRRQQHNGEPVRNVPCNEPAPTLTGIAGAKSQWVWEGSDGTSVLTLAEALTIQSFRPDYPVQGNKGQQFEQVGNAVPPLLAARVVDAIR